MKYFAEYITHVIMPEKSTINNASSHLHNGLIRVLNLNKS